jgi:hypothetical protein
VTPIRHLYRRRDIDVYIGGQLRLQALVSQTEACLRLFLTHTRRANRPRFRDITRVHITLRAAGLDRDFERAEKNGKYVFCPDSLKRLCECAHRVEHRFRSVLCTKAHGRAGCVSHPAPGGGGGGEEEHL